MTGIPRPGRWSVENLFQRQAVLGSGRNGVRVDEVPQDHRRRGGELAGVAQVGEHAVHAVGLLVDVLDEEDLAPRVELVGGPHRRADQRQVPAHDLPLRPASRQRSEAGGSVRQEPQRFRRCHCFHEAFPRDSLLPLRGELHRGHGAVEGHEIPPLAENRVKNRDVAVPHERLGVRRHEAHVQEREEAPRAVPAPQAHDPLDRRVGKGPVKVGQANLVGTRHEPPLQEAGLPENRLEPEPLERFRSLRELFFRGRASRAHDGDAVSGTQCPGLVSHDRPSLERNVNATPAILS